MPFAPGTSGRLGASGKFDASGRLGASGTFLSPGSPFGKVSGASPLRLLLSCAATLSLVSQLAFPFGLFTATDVAEAKESATPTAESAAGDSEAREYLQDLKGLLGESGTNASKLDVEIQKLDGTVTSLDGGVVYRLDENLTVSGPLEVSLEAGEECAVDLNGHTLTIQTDGEYAVDASFCLGSLAFVDSASWDEDSAVSKTESGGVSETSETGSENANLVLAIDGQTGLPDEISLIRCDNGAGADAKDESAAQAALLLDGVVSDIDCGEGDWSGSVSLLSLGDAHAYLSQGTSLCPGSASVSAVSVASDAADDDRSREIACIQISSEKEDSVTFMEGYTFEYGMHISAPWAEEGDVFAHAASDYPVDALEEALKGASEFSLAEDGSLSCVFDGDSSFVFKANEAADAAVFANATSADGSSEGPSESKGGDVDAGSADAQSGLAANAEGADADGSLAALAATSGVELVTDSAGRVDLVATWEKIGTDQAFTIDEGGTYYLSKDFAVSARLIVNAPEEKVEIDFDGHCLTSTASAGTGILAQAASELVLTGGDSDASMLYLNGSKVYRAIDSAADKLTISDLVIKVCANDESADDSSASQADLSAYAVYASAGVLTCDNSELIVDLSNQTNVGSSWNSTFKNGPSGIYLTSKVGSASITGCSFDVDNSKFAHVTEDSTAGHAYGLYNESDSGVVTIDGCSFDVASTMGQAVGVGGANITLSGEATSVKASAKQQACAFESTAEKGITLDAALTFEAGSQTQGVQAALYSAVPGSQTDGSGSDGFSGAFVFGSAFSATDFGVFIGQDDDTANEGGYRIGSFASGLTDAQKSGVVSMLANAFGSDAPTAIAYDSQGVYFLLVDAKAKARLARSDSSSKLYASAQSALDDMQVGDSVFMLADAGDLSLVASAGEEQSEDGQGQDTLTLDMNGHEAKSLKLSGTGTLRVCSSSGQGSICAQGTSTAVVVSASASLLMEDIDVSCVLANGAASGISSSSTGTLSLSGVNIEVGATRTNAYGIRSTSTSKEIEDISISGGSISVKALAYNVSAYGVAAQSTAQDISISSCPLDIQGTDSTTRGISVNGSLTASGDAEHTSISVKTSAVSNSVAGVYAASGSSPSSESKATLFLDTCSIYVSGPQSGEQGYWCLSTGGNTNDPVWSLDGACDFVSSTQDEIQHYAQALSLGADLSFAGAVHIDTLAAQMWTFASVAQLGDADALASKIYPSEDGIYADCAAVVDRSDQGAEIAWQGTSLVCNSKTQVIYSTLEAGIEAASAGDTLLLQSDVKVNGILSIDKDLSIDLCGHTLTCNAANAALAGSSSSGGAIVVSQAGLTLIDSSQGNVGRMVIRLGSSNESSSATYQGIAVSGGGFVSIDDARIDIAYAGSFSSTRSIALRGIALADGSLYMTGDSTLDVASCETKGALGASDIRGVYVASGSSGSVNIAASCSIVVVNDSKPLSSGSSDYPDYTGDSGTNSSSIVDMIELDLDEKSELYQEILKRFREAASCDSSSDSNGKVYSANIYYATDMTVSSGVSVWAYSDMLTDDQVGYLENIVPKHIFVRSTYQIPLDAYGIYAADSFAGSIEASGSISTQTSTGRSYAAFGCSDSSLWKLDSSKISTVCSDGVYLRQTSTKLDLRNYIDGASTFESRLVYPKSATMSDIKLVKAQKGVCTTSDAAANDMSASASGLTESQLEALLYSYRQGNDKVNVTFSNLHSADGTLLDDRSVEAAYGKTLSESDISEESIKPADYSIGDVTYRFIGWKLVNESSDGIADTHLSTSVFSSTAIDSNVAGATSGEVTYIAVYVPVAEGQHLISFRMGGIVYAYPVDDGEVPTYEECYNSSGLIVPEIDDTQSGYSYTFAGWVRGSSNTEIAQTGDDLVWILDAATEDETYTARYYEERSDGTAQLVYKYVTEEGSAADRDDSGNSFDWTQSINSLLDSKVAPSSTLSAEGNVYSFLGWAPRLSDKEPLYLTDEQSVYARGSEEGYAENTFLVAVYNLTSQLITVKFCDYEGDRVLGEAVDMEGTASINDAMAKAGLTSADIAAPDASKKFRGWNTDINSTEIIEARSTLYKVMESDEAPEGSTVLWLYPIFGLRTFTVTFYDSIGGSKLGSVDVDYHMTVKGSNPDFSDDEMGDSFAGWVTADGTPFSVDKTLVTQDIDVYATFATASKETKLTENTKSVSSDVATKQITTNSLSSLSKSLGNALSSNVLSVNELTSSALAASIPTLATSALASVTEDAASGTELAAAQDDTDASFDSDGSLGAKISLGVVVAALLGLVAFIIVWFARRNSKESEEAEVAVAGVEEIHF